MEIKINKNPEPVIVKYGGTYFDPVGDVVGFLDQRNPSGENIWIFIVFDKGVVSTIIEGTEKLMEEFLNLGDWQYLPNAKIKSIEIEHD